MDQGAQHVVPVYTVEQVGDEHKVLVMKYMAGEDLAVRLREHRQGMPVAEVVRVARDICRGLAVAHGEEVDVVHRDVKPSNILFDEQGKAYVADFGLAQLSGMSSRSHGVDRAHPRTQMYAAPEQTRSPEPLTPAADVYALGCVLFEMLTGKRYKRVRPGTRVNALRLEVPAWLDEVVARCVVEEPWDRYEDAGEVLAALEAGVTQWEEWYERGQAALAGGAWGEAIEALEALVAEAPEYLDAAQMLERARQERLAALYREGRTLLARREWKAAVEALEALLREEPAYGDAKGLLEQAKEGLKEERQRQERWAQLYKRGKAALERGQWERAIKALKVLGEEVPEYKDVKALLARARQEQQRQQRESQEERVGFTGKGADEGLHLYPGHPRYPTLADAVAALPPGGTIHLAPGVYRLKEPLVIDKPLALIGEDRDTTVVAYEGDGNVVRYTGAGVFKARHITFRHLGGTWGSVMVVEDGVVDFEHCRFTGGVWDKERKRGGTGILFWKNAVGGKVVHCLCDRNGLHGISVHERAAPVLVANRCEKNTYDGIVYWGESGGEARENVCRENGLHGISVHERAAPVLVANRCEKNAQDGIVYFGDSGGEARENVCRENDFDGIKIRDQAKPILVTNRCRKNGLNGIVYWGNSVGKASKNECRENGLSGIAVLDQAAPRLIANRCEQNMKSGIIYGGQSAGEASENECRKNNLADIAALGLVRPTLKNNICLGNKVDNLYVAPVAKPVLKGNRCP